LANRIQQCALAIIQQNGKIPEQQAEVKPLTDKSRSIRTDPENIPIRAKKKNKSEERNSSETTIFRILQDVQQIFRSSF